MRQRLAACLATCVLTASAVAFAQTPIAFAASHYPDHGHGGHAGHPGMPVHTATPIRHLVVIFQENVSFDHYFGTYPDALNAPGEPSFHARPFTPKVNGLSRGLLSHNPNQANPETATARSIRSACRAPRPPRPIRTTTTPPSNSRSTTAGWTCFRSTPASARPCRERLPARTVPVR